MKSKWKVLCIGLALTMGTAVFTGCKKETPNSATDIEVSYWSSGLGTVFMENIIDAFNQSQSEYKAFLTPSSEPDLYTSSITQGERYNSVDIYFTANEILETYTYLEPLTDVFAYTVPGESRSIGEKVDTEYVQYYGEGEQQPYSVSFGGGWVGIVYNADFVPNGQEIYTTEDLSNLVMELDAQDIVPFVHSGGGGYWRPIYQTWQAQYDGYDYYMNQFLTLTDDQGNSPAESVLEKEDGRRKVLDLLGQIVIEDYVVNGSNSVSFTTAQTYFINGSAAMMANGSWLQNEMRNTDSEYKNFRMMRVPVLNAITENFEGADRGMGNTKLRDIIRKIDAGTPYSESEYGCLESTFKRVREARSLMGNNFEAQKICIPNYSVAKEGAKEFLQFFCSDEGISIYEDTLHLKAPVSYSDGRESDTAEWTDFEKDLYSFRTLTPVPSEYYYLRSPVFSAGGADAYAGIDIIGKLSAHEGDSMTASQIWEQMMQTFSANWSTYLENAGIAQ